MLRSYISLAAVLVILFTTCGFALTSLSSTQPVHPSLRGFVEGCEGIPQPCWYGIVPGVTSATDATANLAARGFVVTREYNDSIYGCSEYSGEVALTLCVTNINANMETNLVARIEFPSLGVMAEDVFAAIGVPESVFLTDTLSISLRYSSKMWIYLSGNSQTFVTYAGYSDVTMIALYMQDNTSPQFAWMGFAPHWRYCQLAPQSSLC